MSAARPAAGVRAFPTCWDGSSFQPIPHVSTISELDAAPRNKCWSGDQVAGSSPVSPTDAQFEFTASGCAVRWAPAGERGVAL
jgi:hypothetical protein